MGSPSIEQNEILLALFSLIFPLFLELCLWSSKPKPEAKIHIILEN